MLEDIWCLFFAILIANVLAESRVDPVIQAQIRRVQYKHRCTRRFTPGVCLAAVDTVWTFDFQLMNCTERLGCPQSRRTNRFRRFATCARRCRPLVDTYLQLLSRGGDTGFFLRKMPKLELRRDGTVDVNPEILMPPTPEDEEYPGDEAVMADVMYGDKHDNRMDDVDFQPEVNEPDDYFSFHV